MSCATRSTKTINAALLAGIPTGAGKGGYLAGLWGWLKRLRRFFRRSAAERQNTPLDYAALPQLEPAKTPARAAAPAFSPLAGAAKATNVSPARRPGGPLTSDALRLQETAVDIVLGAAGSERLVRLEQAFAVLRGNRPTGMALTPMMALDAQGQLGPNGAWGVTHIDTGQLIAGDFAGLDQAEGLATLLAGIDWTRPFETMSQSEIDGAKQIIARYRQTLAGQGDGVGDEDLTGQLVSDGFGDLAYVVEDHGRQLVLANPRDGRYVLPRQLAGRLNEATYRQARLARPLEPADGTRCAGCNLAADSREVQAWHAIDGPVYCQDCSPAAAKAAGCTFAEDWAW